MGGLALGHSATYMDDAPDKRTLTCAKWKNKQNLARPPTRFYLYLLANAILRNDPVSSHFTASCLGFYCTDVMLGFGIGLDVGYLAAVSCKEG